MEASKRASGVVDAGQLLPERKHALALGLDAGLGRLVGVEQV